VCRILSHKCVQRPLKQKKIKDGHPGSLFSPRVDLKKNNLDDFKRKDFLRTSFVVKSFYVLKLRKLYYEGLKNISSKNLGGRARFYLSWVENLNI
jgi:hypothetical protein